MLIWIANHNFESQLKIQRTESYTEYFAFMQAMGRDEFIAWAKETGQPHLDDFLSVASTYTPEPKQADSDEKWLKSYLEGRGPIHTDEIKRSAIDAGIIGENDALGWERLKKRAQLCGLTGGKYSHWQYSAGRILDLSGKERRKEGSLCA